MWNDYSCYKRITFNAFIVFVIILFSFIFITPQEKVAFAENGTTDIENEINDNINDILNDIETDDLDKYLVDNNLDFFENLSFKDLISKILSGEYFSNYDSIFDFLSENFINNLKPVMSFLLMIFAVVILLEIFKTFCADKYSDIKASIKYIFLLVITLMLFSSVKSLCMSLSENIDNIFEMSNILFPILLSLVLSSGATGTYSVYSSLSVFVLSTGLYIFKYILMPLAISIVVLSLIDLIISGQRFSKFNNLLKYIFKLIVTILFSIFGLFSLVNVVTSGLKDGLSFKVAKFAIKNYVPILGGYISEGFDFFKSCSVIVKNAFGICGIILLFFIVIKPLILYLVFIIGFKILAALTSFIGSSDISSTFENVSKGLSYLLAVLIGLFLIMLVFIFLIIISVGL